MDFNEFKKQCVDRGFFKENGYHIAEKGERIRIKVEKGGLDINRFLGFTINSPKLGFNIQAVLAAEGGGEYIYISGTKKKDGIYFFDNECCFISVEELEDNFLESDEFADICTDAGIEPDDYEELSADKKVAVFEKAEQIDFSFKTFDELLENLERAKFAPESHKKPDTAVKTDDNLKSAKVEKSSGIVAAKIDLNEFNVEKYHCQGIVPIGGNKCVLVFTIGHRTEGSRDFSVFFEVENFDPKKARVLQTIDADITSLTATPDGKIFALEKNSYVWTYDGKEWSTEKSPARTFSHIVGGDVLDGPFIIGQLGNFVRLVNGKWTALDCPSNYAISGVSNHSDHGLIACGSYALFRLKNGTWEKTKMPVDAFACEIDSTGVIRLSGDRGACVEIRDDEISMIKAPKVAILSIKTIEGTTYWRTRDHGILVQDKKSLKPIDPKQKGAPQYSYMTGKDAVRFDANGGSLKLKVVYEKDQFQLKISDRVVPTEDDDDDE